MTSAPCHGLFINLDRNAERRAFLESHLSQLGLSYERVPAVDGRAAAADHPTSLDAGNLGLWLTHERILDAHRDSASHLHIIEDDALLCRDFVRLSRSVLEKLDREPGGWDLLFTDRMLQPETSTFTLMAIALDQYRHTGAIDAVPLLRLPAFAGTTSFFLNRRSIGKYANVMRGNWKAGRGIDLFIRDAVEQGRLTAYFTAPLLSTLSTHAAASDIRGPLDRSRSVFDAFRRTFFADANDAESLSRMNELTQGLVINSELSAVFLKAQRYTLSQQYVPF
jgi:GR25 family glycosyltransferase involved in LPS biosynthesis